MGQIDLGWKGLEREAIARHFGWGDRAGPFDSWEDAGRTSVAGELCGGGGEGADERERGSSVFIIVLGKTATCFSVIRTRDTPIRQCFFDLFQVCHENQDSSVRM